MLTKVVLLFDREQALSARGPTSGSSWPCDLSRLVMKALRHNMSQLSASQQCYCKRDSVTQMASQRYSALPFRLSIQQCWQKTTMNLPQLAINSFLSGIST